jgi:hypothetical protein
MHVHWSFRTPVIFFLATAVNMLELLNFWNLVMGVFSLNFVALSGFLGMFKHINTREEICT